METLGEYLKNRREEKDLTLQQIAHITKINISYLQAIENNDFQKLPAPAFVKGFLRHYAQCIGLDPEDVVFRFRTAIQGEKETQNHSIQKKGFPKKSSWIIFGVLLLLLVVWFLLTPESGKKHERIRAIRTPHISEYESKKTFFNKELGIDGEAFDPRDFNQVEQESGSDVSKSKEIAQRIALTVQAVQITWMLISIDNNPAFEITMSPGDQVSWNADEKIRLKIGNAGGIKIFYNGKLIEGLGKIGEVVQIAFPLPKE